MFFHLGINKNKIIFVDHSLGHIFYSFFALGRIRNTLSISMDAFGDFINYRAVKFYIKNKKNLYKRNCKKVEILLSQDFIDT